MVRKGKKIGRPNTLGESARITVRLPSTLLEALGEWYDGGRVPIAGVIRLAIEKGIDRARVGYLESRLQTISKEIGEDPGELLDRFADWITEYKEGIEREW